MSFGIFDSQRVLSEDAPFLDLTTHWLGIGNRSGSIRFMSRNDGVLSGSDAAAHLLREAGCVVESQLTDGTPISGGDTLLEARGRAQALHRAWKSALSMLDHCSGIATRTAVLVRNARSGNPSCGVFASRKHMPGVKGPSIKAILDGGALPHRLGLSETIFIFDQHKAFFPSREALCGYIAANRSVCCEKKILVEVADFEEAEAFLNAGVDGVQFDKVSPQILRDLVRDLRSGTYASRVLIAAGGINADNAAAYAETGVDGIATSWPYDGKPLDMTAIISSED